MCVASINETTAACKGTDMIKRVPLNMSECLEAQAKSKAYACLALLQIKVNPPFTQRPGHAVYLFHHRPPLQQSAAQNFDSPPETKNYFQGCSSSCLVQNDGSIQKRDVYTKVEKRKGRNTIYET